MTNLFQLNWRQVGSAVLSGVVTAVLAYLSTLTNIVEVSTEQLISVAVLATITSLLKAFSSDGSGKILGKF
jgi:hypothetical protein